MHKRSFWQKVAILTTIIGSMFSFQATAAFTDADAMNESGRQRMLTQRMAKSWLMLGMEIDVKEAEKQRDESLARFEKNFLLLQEYAFTSGMEKAVNDVGRVWQQYRMHILSAPSKEKAQVVLAESDRLLKASEVLVQEIQKSTRIHSAEVVNVSGRQRMLSQRIAKLYLAEAWRIDDASQQKKMDKTVNEFETALKFLKASSLNNPSITSQLKKVENQWKFSKTGFQLNQNGQYVPTVISVTTESILKKMDKITGEYAEAMKAQGS